jgi:hypothetical protein
MSGLRVDLEGPASLARDCSWRREKSGARGAGARLHAIAQLREGVGRSAPHCRFQSGAASRTRRLLASTDAVTMVPTRESALLLVDRSRTLARGDRECSLAPIPITWPERRARPHS